MTRVTQDFIYVHTHVHCILWLPDGSSYADYLSMQLVKLTNNVCHLFRFGFISFVRNRFFVWMIRWVLINLLLPASWDLREFDNCVATNIHMKSGTFATSPCAKIHSGPTTSAPASIITCVKYVVISVCLRGYRTNGRTFFILLHSLCLQSEYLWMYNNEWMVCAWPVPTPAKSIRSVVITS